MKLLSLFTLFFLISISSFAQAPSCSTQTVMGNCVNGQLVDGRHYIFDSAGKVIQIRLYLDGKFVGTALLDDTALPKSATPSPRIDTIKTETVPAATIAPIRYKVDTTTKTVDCSGFKYPDPSILEGLPVTDGNGTWVTSNNGRTRQNGYFIDNKLQCGVEYLYNKKGVLVTVNIYREGKITETIPVPKKKRKK